MKIKVVDVETQQGEAGQQLATIDEAEEDYNSSKTLSSSSKEEDEPDPITGVGSHARPPGEEEEEQKLVLPEGHTERVKDPFVPTKQRVQQLHKCEKCGKMLTLKSLRYSHSKYCGKVSEPVETKMKPEPKVRFASASPVSEPAPVNEPAPPPVKEKTFDEMRKERHEQRRAAHKESIQKLFARAV